MRFFLGYLEDNFVITPALVVSLGRCPAYPEVIGAQISLSWINVEVGIEFDL